MRFLPRVFAVLFLFTCFTNIGMVGLAQGNCFPHSVAYLAGVMNIRESSTTSSAIVGQTKAGDRFNVLDTAQSRSWCWIKIEDGWIAKTSLVTDGIQKSNIPDVRTLSQPPICTAGDYIAYAGVLNELTGDFGTRLGGIQSPTEVEGFARRFFKWRDELWAKLSHCDPLYPIRDDYIVVTTDLLIGLLLKFSGMPVRTNSYARDFQKRWDSMLDYTGEVITTVF